jgi:hypothetical protein
MEEAGPGCRMKKGSGDWRRRREGIGGRLAWWGSGATATGKGIYAVALEIFLALPCLAHPAVHAVRLLCVLPRRPGRQPPCVLPSRAARQKGDGSLPGEASCAGSAGEACYACGVDAGAAAWAGEEGGGGGPARGDWARVSPGDPFILARWKKWTAEIRSKTRSDGQ